MSEVLKKEIVVFPLEKNLSGDFYISDHINLSGKIIKEVGFVPLAEIYTEIKGLKPLKVAAIKDGTRPNEAETKKLLEQGVQAYSYEIFEIAAYAAANEKKLQVKASIVKIPKDFKVAGLSAGIKESGKKDLALLVSEVDCSWAGCFTQNAIKAACVTENQKKLGKKIQALVCNSGNANACTGEEGIKNNLELENLVRESFSLERALTASTGKIGVQLDSSKIKNCLDKKIKLGQNSDDILDFAEAMLTTDLKIKVAQSSSMTGFAKGSGMIEPNMATMLAFIITDKKVTNAQKILNEVVAETFNAITVDSDTSTNDMVLLISSETAGEISAAEFRAELFAVCHELARKIVLDGEGNTKLIHLEISGYETLANDAQLASKRCDQIAKSILNSPLVKTAIYGNDPNWGRVMAAAGKVVTQLSEQAEERQKIADLIENASLCLLGREIFAKKVPLGFGRKELSQQMAKSREITLRLELLGASTSKKSYYGSDLSYDYVQINAEYFT